MVSKKKRLVGFLVLGALAYGAYRFFKVPSVNVVEKVETVVEETISEVKSKCKGLPKKGDNKEHLDSIRAKGIARRKVVAEKRAALKKEASEKWKSMTKEEKKALGKKKPKFMADYANERLKK
jgi:hypothetical protein